MPLPRLKSLREGLLNPTSLRFLFDAGASVSLNELARGTSLNCDLAALADRSILIYAQDQLAAAMAMIQLDGVARRMMICPPDIRPEQLPFIIDKGGVDTIVVDNLLAERESLSGLLRVACGTSLVAETSAATEHHFTEWVLLSSGTTGAPKMIVHSLASLTAAMLQTQGHDDQANKNQGAKVVWGTFYDMRRFGGLQILLRAVLGNGSMVLSNASEPVADHLTRLGARGVTHLSGTPSHWRRALMSPQARAISPAYVRLSGEIADQAILNSLHSFFPNAAIGHAFASTEAGVAFDVNDGLAGFPASFLGKRGDVEMKVADDTLRIRSDRNAVRYLDGENGSLIREDGFVDTGDVVEARENRYYFLGRRNGVINVGGMKVYPEEVEAVINRHPAVRMSMVRSRKNPITGALVAADIVLNEVTEQTTDLKAEVLEICRQHLPPHKIPATIRYVSTLEIAAAGKLVRSHA